MPEKGCVCHMDVINYVTKEGDAMPILLKRLIDILESCVAALKVLMSESGAKAAPGSDPEIGSLPKASSTSAAPVRSSTTVVEPASVTEAAPQLRHVEAGMWYCEPRNGIPDFRTDIQVMRKGGINCAQSWDSGQIFAKWKGIPDTDWAIYQGEGWAGWVNRLASMNKRPSAFDPLRTILFKPIWGAVASGKRSVREIERMCKAFAMQLQEPQDVMLRAVHGVCLGDDFAKHPKSTLYTETIKAIGDILGPTRFYMSNQLFDPAVYANTRAGTQMAALRGWIKPIVEDGHTFVYLPQYYPWVGRDWRKSNPHWYDWLRIGISECIAQKRIYPNSFEVQPILQASAWGQRRGPSHSDMHQQIRVSLDAGSDGVWFIGWHNPSYPSLKCYWDSRSNFGQHRSFDEAIKSEMAQQPCALPHGS